jgi:hypothetical protein
MRQAIPTQVKSDKIVWLPGVMPCELEEARKEEKDEFPCNYIGRGDENVLPPMRPR